MKRIELIVPKGTCKADLRGNREKGFSLLEEILVEYSHYALSYSPEGNEIVTAVSEHCSEDYPITELELLDVELPDNFEKEFEEVYYNDEELSGYPCLGYYYKGDLVIHNRYELTSEFIKSLPINKDHYWDDLVLRYLPWYPEHAIGINAR